MTELDALEGRDAPDTIAVRPPTQALRVQGVRLPHRLLILHRHRWRAPDGEDAWLYTQDPARDMAPGEFGEMAVTSGETD